MKKLLCSIVARISRVAAVVTVFAAMGAASSQAVQQQKIAKIDLRYNVGENGDASCVEDFSLPVQGYAKLKEAYPNPIAVLRAMQQMVAWRIMDDLQGTFDDANSQMHSSYVQRGLARPVKDGLWQLSLDGMQDLDLVAIDGKTAFLTTATETPLGLTTLKISVRVPDGSSDVNFDVASATLTYRLVPLTDPADKISHDFAIDTKKHVVSSLAKLYGDQRFSSLWVGRSVFCNQGNSAIRKYRVRFRVAGFSDWSAWNKTEIVYPKQTVIDPFFPVFDFEALAELNGNRPATVEAEYEYEDETGKRMTETDSRRIQLTSRNDVVFSTRPDSDVLTWKEGTDLAPLVIAAFTTSQDPVVQQVAGGVCTMSKMAGNAAGNAANAEQFLRNMWRFLESNNVSYQTPPGFSINGNFGQHIKYSRDVLRNHAGTCVDLAILWASTAKAVGLESFIVLTPTHAFPIIQIPGGTRIAIESTMIGNGNIDQAVEEGTKQFETAQAGQHYIVDINVQQSLGVCGLDLENVDADYLTKLGYRFPVETIEPSVEVQEQVTGQEITVDTETPTELTDAIRGVWVTEVDADQTHYGVMCFYEDGKYLFQHCNEVNGEGTVELETPGTWTVQEEGVVLRLSQGQMVAPASVDGDVLQIVINNELFELYRSDL